MVQPANHTSTTQDPDEITNDLVRAAQKGNREAFGQLYRMHKKIVYGILHKKMGNFHDIEDVSQEVWRKVYRKLNTFKLNAKFTTWLVTITIRAVADYYKKNAKSQQTVSLDDEDQNIRDPRSVAPGYTDTMRIVLARESLCGVESALATDCSENERQALVCHLFSDEKDGEIASRLVIPASTVTRQRFTTRERLRAVLGVAAINA